MFLLILHDMLANASAGPGYFPIPFAKIIKRKQCDAISGRNFLKRLCFRTKMCAGTAVRDVAWMALARARTHGEEWKCRYLRMSFSTAAVMTMPCRRQLPQGNAVRWPCKL